MNLYIRSTAAFGTLAIKKLGESSVKESFQYQIAEFCCHDKF